jgi:hypothetical protein
MNRLVSEFAAVVADRPKELERNLGRFPLSLFDDARQYLGFERAVALVERGDLQALARRMEVTEHLFSDRTPFYQLPELAQHAADFVEFLRTHRNYLIATGLPPLCFRPCRWLYTHLGRLYDTRTTASPYPYDELFSNGTRERDPYQWVRVQMRLPLAPKRAGSVFVPCRYEDADLLSRMRMDDAERIERERPRMFDLKLQIVKLLADATRKGNASGLRGASLDVLKNTFNADEIRFYLRLDDYYMVANSLSGVDFVPASKWSPGGLTNILEVLGHCEAEVIYKMYDNARGSIPVEAFERLAADNEHRIWRYFDIVDSPHRQQFDVVIDALLDKADTVQGFRAEYCKWLEAALCRDFRVLVHIEMLARHAEALRPLVQDQANAMQEKRERGDYLIARQDGQNVFRRDGNSWTIGFDGKTIPKIAVVGLSYIHELLKYPGKKFSGSDLRKLLALRRCDPQSRLRSDCDRVILATERSDADDDEEGDFDALHAQATDSGDLVDNIGLQDYQKTYADLTKSRKVALEKGDHETAAKLAEERKVVGGFLRRATTPSGAIRKMRSDDKNANDAVRSAIERASDDLCEALPSLGKHFAQFLSIGGKKYCYNPDLIVPWDL